MNNAFHAFQTGLDGFRQTQIKLPDRRLFPFRNKERRHITAGNNRVAFIGQPLGNVRPDKTITAGNKDFYGASFLYATLVILPFFLRILIPMRPIITSLATASIDILAKSFSGSRLILCTMP